MAARVRKSLAALGLFALLGFAAYWVGTRYFPLEIAEWKNARELRSVGAFLHETRYEQKRVSAWVRNHCSESDPGCRCLVLIHGLGDRATTWKRVLKAEPSTWQQPLKFIAVDLPGNGESEPPAHAAGFGLRNLAQAVIALARSVPQCGDYWVVGNSMGGGVGVWVALDPSFRIRRLILLSPGGIDLPKEGGASALLKDATVESLKEFQRRAYYEPRALPDYVWRAAAKRARDSSSGKIISAQTPEDFSGTRIREIKAPVILLWGLSDHIISVEEGRALSTRFPTAVLREIPRCGHMPQKECPEALYSAVNDLLRAGG
jgi:pimeloyl-ACP methyl ester carboxylesterase